MLVGAYLLVRCIHLTLHAVAATGDPGLRRQIAITWPPTLAGAALLVAGALLGGWTQMHHALSLPRLVATGVLVAALPAAILVPPLVGLAGLVVILAAVIVVETTRYAPVRRNLRCPSR